MPARYDKEKGYIIELSSRKQFSELCDKGAIGVESIDMGMFYVVFNFSFKDGDVTKFKKHGNNHYNKTHGLGNYRPEEEATVMESAVSEEQPPHDCEPPLPTEPPCEGEELTEAEEPQSWA